MTHLKPLPASFLLLLALLAACVFPIGQSTPPSLSQEDQINTAAAKTVAALATSIAEGRNPTLGGPLPAARPTNTSTVTPAVIVRSTTTPTPTLTNTPRPGVTAQPTVTASTQDIPCNRATFVRDVTIPDGTTLLANSTFTKTWELKNNGACTWNSSYSVVFAGQGSVMDGPAATPIMTEGEVKPGESVMVSVTLRAPSQPGEYKGYWMLRSGDAKTFGTGTRGGSPFFVLIQVGEEYFFARDVCAAKWSTAAGELPCPGKESDSQGYVVSVENPTLENNEQAEGRGISVAAQPVPNGYIVGRFPAVMVPGQSDFRATLSCQRGADGCYVRFRVTYQIDGGQEQLLGEWNEGYEGGITEAIRDLDDLAGRSVSFNFYVSVAGTPDKSKAIWFNPRIVR